MSSVSTSSAGLWLRRLGALVVKECKEIVRDPSSYLVAGLMPALLLLIFGYGITLDVDRLEVSILDQSGSQPAQQVLSAFIHSPSFTVVPAANQEAAEKLFRDARIKGIIIVRQDFGAAVARGQAGALQILVDGADANTAKFIQGYAQMLINRWQQSGTGSLHSPAIEALPRYWYNATANSRNYLVPGSITVIMTLIGTLLTSLVFAREWERGTMEAMLATPASRLQLLLGKLIPYFGMGMLSMLVCAAAAVWIFSVPFRGSLWVLLLLSAIFLLTALGQGLLISVLTRTQLLAAQAGLFSGFLPALLLSGFVFDIASMPYALQIATLLLPARYFNVCLQTVFLAGDIWSVFLPCIGAMLALGAALLALVYHNLQKRLDV